MREHIKIIYECGPLQRLGTTGIKICLKDYPNIAKRQIQKETFTIHVRSKTSNFFKT